MLTRGLRAAPKRPPLAAFSAWTRTDERPASSWVSDPAKVIETLYGARVSSVELDSERSIGAGENSRLAALSYTAVEERDGARKAYSVVVKRRPESAAAREVAAIQRWYEREVFFYTKLADRVGVQSPRCAAASYEPTTGAFALVLEDLSLKPFTNNHEAALRGLARLHATALPKDVGPLPKAPATLELAGLVEDYFRSAWRTKVRRSYAWPTDVAQLIDALCAPGVYTALVRRLAGADGPVDLALVHGDFRPANLFFDPLKSNVLVCDWQFLSVASPAYDLAYYLGLALHPDDRRRREAFLRDAYLDERARCRGGPGSSTTPFFGPDLQVGVLLSLASFVIGAASASDQLAHRASINTLAAAALDWRASDVLRSLPHPSSSS